MPAGPGNGRISRGTILDDPGGTRANHDLDSELSEVRKQLELARLRRCLVETVRDYPMLRMIPEYDQKRARVLRGVLTDALNQTHVRAAIPNPQHVDVTVFVRDWVQEHWITDLSHVSFEGSEVPRSVIEQALKDLYAEDYRMHESLQEVAELEKKGFRSFGPRPLRQTKHIILVPVMGALTALLDLLRLPARFFRLAAPQQKARAWVQEQYELYFEAWSNFWFTKKASEIRAERRQHWVQKVFSSTGFVFTGCAAIFMSLMLFVGLVSLWNAACQGLGIPWEWGGAEAHAALPEHASAVSRHLPNPELAMRTSLSALEIILVAPLPYLLVLGLMRYIKALAYQERADEFRKELLEFKAFEVALFIAIIAAAVVGRILEKDFEWRFAAGVAFVIGVLAVYYYLIEKSGSDAEAEAKTAPGGQTGFGAGNHMRGLSQGPQGAHATQPEHESGAGSAARHD